MFTLGIIGSQARQCNRILRHSKSEPIDFNSYRQDDGFYIFEFPDVDYYDFKDIVLLLKTNGITTIGADSQLTEKKIMKLTDLIKEQNPEQEYNRMESADDIVSKLEEILALWERKEYASDKERYENYYLDIEELVEDYKENQSIDKPDVDIQEQKLRKLIKNLIKEWRR